MADTEEERRQPNLTRYSVLGVVLIYAIFAALWILLSDKAMEWAFESGDSYALASTLKGWLFVAITSLLLYSLLRRISEDGIEEKTVSQTSPLGIPFLLLALLILAITAGAVSYTFLSQEQTGIARLKTIAELKAKLITDWLTARDKEAAFIQRSRYYAEQYRQWQQTGNPAYRDNLAERLSIINHDWGFNGIMLHRNPGEHLWSTSSKLHHSNNVKQRETEQLAQTTGTIQRIGPYLDSDKSPHLDFIIPLTKAADPPPLAILHIDLSKAFFETLQSWPIPSKSGDTVLFRKEDNEVLFLNSLRHHEGDALSLRTSLTQTNRITTKVFEKNYSSGDVVRGTDYRDTAAISVVHSIPGTDWFILAKLDRSEFYAEAVKDSIWIALAGVLALFMTTVSLIMMRQSQKLALAEGIREAQSERLRALNLLSSIAEGSSDAIFAKDHQGRYILFNRAASRIVGREIDEVLGHDDRQLFPAEQAERIMAEDRRVASGTRIESQEETLDTANGTRIFLTTKGPLQDADNNTIGSFGISRDITDKKTAESKLLEQSEILQEMSAIAHVGGWWFDPKSGIGNWTEEVARMHGVDPQDSVSEQYGLEFFRGEHRKKIEHAVTMAVEEGHPYDLELEMITAQGEPRWVRTQGHPVIRNGKVVQVRGAIQDITERKIVEFDVERQTEELRQRNEELERFNRASVGREMDMIRLKKEINVLSVELGREAPYDLSFLDEAPERES